MCDEYDDEKMLAFWRRFEQTESREHSSPGEEEAAEPLVRVDPGAAFSRKTKPRTLMH